MPCCERWGWVVALMRWKPARQGAWAFALLRAIATPAPTWVVMVLSVWQSCGATVMLYCIEGCCMCRRKSMVELQYRTSSP